MRVTTDYDEFQRSQGGRAAPKVAPDLLMLPEGSPNPSAINQGRPIPVAPRGGNSVDVIERSGDIVAPGYASKTSQMKQTAMKDMTSSTPDNLSLLPNKASDSKAGLAIDPNTKRDIDELQGQFLNGEADDYDSDLEERIIDALEREGYEYRPSDGQNEISIGVRAGTPIEEARDKMAALARQFEVPVPATNPDGTVTLFHGTSPESARSILADGFNDEPYLSATTDIDSGGVSGAGFYGKTILETKVDPRELDFNVLGEFRAPSDAIKSVRAIDEAPKPSAKMADAVSIQPKKPASDPLLPESNKPSNGLSFTKETADGENRLIIDLWPTKEIRGKGITKSETLKAFVGALNDGHTIVEPSNGMWTKDGTGFMNNLESQGYVKKIPNRGGIIRYEITPAVKNYGNGSEADSLYHGTNDISWAERGEPIRRSESSTLGHGGIFFEKDPKKAGEWIAASGGYSKSKEAGKRGGVVKLEKSGGGKFKMKKMSETEYERQFFGAMDELYANPSKFGTDKYGVHDARAWEIVEDRLKKEGYDGVDFGSTGVLFDPASVTSKPVTGKSPSKILKGDGAIREIAETPVFHGTLAKFKDFDRGFLGGATGASSAKEGFFFASNPNTALTYASKGAETMRVAPGQMKDLRAKLKELTGSDYTRIYYITTDLEKNPDAFGVGKKREVMDVIKKIQKLEANTEDAVDDVFGVSGSKKAGAIKEARLRMDNPLEFDANEDPVSEIGITDIIKNAKRDGRDGVIIRNTYDSAVPTGEDDMTDVYVVFDESQIMKAPKKKN